MEKVERAMMKPIGGSSTSEEKQKQISQQIQLKSLQEQIKEIKTERDYYKKELETYKLHYTAAIHQREQLKCELEENRQAYQAIQNAFFWKITKPFRLLFGGIERLAWKLKPLRLIIRGFQSLFTDGIRTTWDRILVRISRKKRMEAVIAQFRLTGEERKQQEETRFSTKLKFSILVPLYNTPETYLCEMIESVLQQTYSDWELCLADGSDPDQMKVEKICRKYQRKDSRIRYQRLKENRGISENTNACIDMSVGDYLVLFDHDDLLHPSALFEVRRIIEQQGADFIYTDEATFEKTIDHIITAHFKPDYALDTLRGNNYICHLSTFRKTLLKQAGKFRKEFDGSQDHDMILRLTEAAEKIVHIPKILYYWRSHPASVAADINSKTYAIDAGKKAVRESIHRSGLEAEVESSRAFPTIYRIRYHLKKEPLVSILIPNKDHLPDLQRCITSILERTTYSNYEIILMDNGSTDPEVLAYYKYLEQEKQIRQFVWDKPFNYSAINNEAAKAAKGEYLLLLNNDTKVITPDWIQEMLMYAQREDVGAVGAMLYYKDNTVQHAGVVIGLGADRAAGHIHYRQPKENFGYMGRMCYAQDLSAVTAACMMVRKKLYQELHGLDERFGVAFNDIDFCLRIRRKGLLVVFTPYAELYHYESKTRGAEEGKEKKRRFQNEVKLFHQRWDALIKKGDPYYNPNFSLDRDDFSLR